MVGRQAASAAKAIAPASFAARSADWRPCAGPLRVKRAGCQPAAAVKRAMSNGVSASLKKCGGSTERGRDVFASGSWALGPFCRHDFAPCFAVGSVGACALCLQNLSHTVSPIWGVFWNRSPRRRSAGGERPAARGGRHLCGQADQCWLWRQGGHRAGPVDLPGDGRRGFVARDSHRTPSAAGSGAGEVIWIPGGDSFDSSSAISERATEYRGSLALPLPSSLIVDCVAPTWAAICT